ncbi:MAG: transporter substrate-binding domain-containing protein, partial [Acholeplasmatales bacterium]|nr:transporter substrate-binding domain-containing protein [Acholeplasmatales bacterium]
MRKLFRLLSIMLITIIGTVFLSVNSNASSNTTVKVGFMHEKGYHEISEDGTYSGYGYEYLQMISQYSNLNFEYIGYDVTDFNTMLDMLYNGDIDIITNVSQTEDRLEKFAFSDKPMGNCATVISVKNDNNSIIQGDYSTYDGMNVGLVAGMGFNELFFEYAEEEGFTYNVHEPYYENISDAEKALQNGEIDSLVYADFRVSSNEKIVDMIESHAVFTITRKEGTEYYTESDKKLLKTINSAMEYLDTFEEGWRTNLKHKYFSSSGDSLYLTAKEKEVLRKYSSLGNEKLTVIGAPNMEPYIWFEKVDGKYIARGLYGVLFDELIKEAGKEFGGINYEVIVPSNYDEYLSLISLDNPNRPDIILGYEEMSVQDAQTGYIQTAIFDRASVSRVYTKNLVNEVHTIAYLKSMPYMEPMILNLHPEVNLVACDTADEALELLNAGLLDMFYTLEYSAMQHTYLDQRGLLKQLEIYNGNVQYSFGVNNQLSHDLVSALSKYIRAYS